MALGGDESVDYLVFGVGFGSSLVLVGWLLRQFGPTFRYRANRDESSGIHSAEELIARQDWRTFCMAVGAILSVSGALMLLVTVVTLLLQPADNTGSIIVGVVFVLTLLGIAGWIALFVSQHENIGGFADLARLDWKSRGTRPNTDRNNVVEADHQRLDATPDDDFGFPAAPVSIPAPARQQATTDDQSQPRATPARRFVNPARPSGRPVAASRPNPNAQTPSRQNQAPPRENRPQTSAQPAQNGDENLLAGVRFSRPRSTSAGNSQGTAPLEGPRTRTPQPLPLPQSQTQSQPPSQPQQQGERLQSPRERAPLVADDVVSSVTMKDAGEGDPTSTREMPRATRPAAQDDTASDATSREAALENLRLRRAGRQDTRES